MPAASAPSPCGRFSTQSRLVNLSVEELLKNKIDVSQGGSGEGGCQTKTCVVRAKNSNRKHKREQLNHNHNYLERF